jgi:dipeptidyl aminopeptidase/acylaminoacyl peptidase
MTSARRFEQDLPATLADLYLAGTPVYRDDLVQHVARTPQRPAWTFPGRWLPMELVTTRVPTTRLPLRQLAVLALIALLLATALAVYVGSQQAKLPPPFGVAGNGLIAYSTDGDIYVSDRAGASPRAVTTGPELDTDPQYSPDGQRLAFLRARGGGGFDLMVARVSGGQPVTLSTSPLRAEDLYEWAPDSTWLLVGMSDKRLVRLDVATPGQPVVIATDAILSPGASVFRPPDGRQIMFTRESVGGLWALDLDGGDAPRLLIDNPMPENRDFRYARWSPDGTMIAFPMTVGDGEQYRVHVARADGTGVRRVSQGDGIWVETDLRWSPDGSRIAFNHWEKQGDGTWRIRPTGVVDITTSQTFAVGPTGVDDGTWLEWSPAGDYIIGVPGPLAVHGGSTTGKATVIDVATGTAADLPWTVRTQVSWQRVAP